MSNLRSCYAKRVKPEYAGDVRVLRELYMTHIHPHSIWTIDDDSFQRALRLSERQELGDSRAGINRALDLLVEIEREVLAEKAEEDYVCKKWATR